VLVMHLGVTTHLTAAVAHVVAELALVHPAQPLRNQRVSMNTD
jgi:hypothetical protein